MNKKSNFKGVAHTTESKECIVCKRLFYNNKSYKSRGIWAEVKYCSDRCRKNKKTQASPLTPQRERGEFGNI
jgi:hypothetical protein